MSELDVKVAWGWRADAPAEVENEFRGHEGQGKTHVLSFLCDSHLSEMAGAGAAMLHRASTGKEAVSGIFEQLAYYLALLGNELADVASLIYLNLEPHKPLLGQDQEPKVVELPSIVAGLLAFSQAVSASVGVATSECEWVMLTCTRTGEADDDVK